MELITFDSDAYKVLEAKINKIFAFVSNTQKGENEGPENEVNQEKLFNSAEVGKILQISTRTLLRIRIKGEISFVRIGGNVRYRQTDIDNYIKSMKILVREQN